MIQKSKPIHKKRSSCIKMFECNKCRRQYSNIGGIVTHQKNTYGFYDPSSISKTENNKSKDNLGRPMRFKINKEKKSEKIESFFNSVQSKYTDKRLEYFLDKNIKFVFNAVMEAGDPIAHKQFKSNLFIQDFKEFDDDPFAEKPGYPVDFEAIFGNNFNNMIDEQKQFHFDDTASQSHGSLLTDDSILNLEHNKNSKLQLRTKEFLTKLLEYIREDQCEMFIQIFTELWNNIEQQDYKIIVQNINYTLKSNIESYHHLKQLNQQQFTDFIHNIVLGSYCYIKQVENIDYNQYFGYE